MRYKWADQTKNNCHVKVLRNRIVKYKIGTLNTAGLGNKTEEIVEIMQRRGIKIMGLADIRCKPHGSKKSSQRILVYSLRRGHSKEWIGLLEHPDTKKCTLDINYSDKIIILKIKRREQTGTFVQLYAPCNDNYTEEQKDDFKRRGRS